MIIFDLEFQVIMWFEFREVRPELDWFLGWFLCFPDIQSHDKCGLIGATIKKKSGLEL